MKIAVLILCLALVAPLSFAAENNSAPAYKPVTVYDPTRDASRDIAEAVAEASHSGRRVLLEIGGKWCKWCGFFDKFFDTNADMRELRDANFVMVKINFSPENENKEVIARYGKVEGYPHIFILGSDGKLLYSEDTSKLEEGHGYSKQAVQQFLAEWSPKNN